MAVEKHVDFKGSRKREIKDVYSTETDIWIPPVPPEVGVDDLWLYRRKRPDHAWLMDNIKIEEGSFHHLKSEYTRRFKNFYDAIKSSLNGKNHSCDEEIKEEIRLKAERPAEYNGSFNRIDSQRSNDFPGGIKNIETANRSKSLESLIKFGGRSPRRSLYRRPTNLKIEGEFYHLTEYADEFVEYLLAKRAILCRTPTTLKLGTGEMETKTESMDQFVRYEPMERPSLCKRFTNLHLEGDLEMEKPENREKFAPFVLPTRPPLVKKPTNLHIQGDYSLIPEYRHQYVQYTNPERTEPILPSHNLKSARLFEGPSGEPHTFGGRTSPLIPFLRDSCNYRGTEEPKSRRSNSSSRYHSTMTLNRASSQPNLTKSAAGEGRKKIRKNAYLEFEGSLERKATPRRAQHEYNNVDLPRGRPRVRKPESHFTSEGEVKYVTENRDKCREKSSVIDDLFGKQEDYREPEGRFECQPEYRKAYLDYLIREKPPQGQRRRILEIPDININDKTINEAELSSLVDKPAKPEPTSKEEKPAPSSPKIAQPIAPSPETDASKSSNRRRGSGKRVFPRSSTPSPAPPADNRSTASPRSGGNWRRHQFKETIGETAAGNAWNSLEADPAFFVLGDRAHSRRTAKKDLYKEQRWMPSWHSGEF
ncbi:unnamed protein product [Phyllotreta striolata]|uniref:Nuclear protein MDM1 n=1 Tax=Phyllotreta striolata TaxID=444603 RepID=A0A9N9XIW6_PHYSR|nr:unnamed protein product [Phyllotreta striolata]